jgi:hypothetical protein
VHGDPLSWLYGYGPIDRGLRVIHERDRERCYQYEYVFHNLYFLGLPTSATSSVEERMNFIFFAGKHYCA